MEQKQRSSILPIIAIIIVTAVLASGITSAILIPRLSQKTPILEPSEKVDENNNINYTYPITQVEDPGPDIIERIKPSIVVVDNMVKGNAYGFGLPSSNKEQLYGSGSGVIVSEDGMIVTNYHVIEGGDTIYVTIGEERLKAEVIGFDSVSDIALLRVDKTGLTAAELGDSSTLREGEMTIAIGSPFGEQFAGSSTRGIISAVNRKLNVDGNSMTLIQTDAAINPGNSGGALVNSKGQVIGINTLKFTAGGTDSSGKAYTAEGMGFAIPINVVKPIVEEIEKSGSVKRPAMGVTIYEVSSAQAKELGIEGGIVVAKVSEDSPAEKAGIKENDIIIEANGTAIRNNNDFTGVITELSIGDKVTVKVYRDGKTLELTATLADMSSIQY